MDLGLTGKRAAVAASTGGLGRAVARRLLGEGCEVAVSGSNRGRLDSAVEELGPGATAVLADLQTVSGATTFVDQAAEALGGLDILVVNGPGPKPGATADLSTSDYRDALLRGLLPSIAMVEAAVPLLTARGQGRIVAITSIAARQPMPNLALSTTSRAGFTGYLKSLALDLAQTGVTVNSVQPGLHATDRLLRVYGDQPSAAVTAIPVGTLGSPDDFAAVVAFLCSKYAGYVTGQGLPVDGGMYRGI